MGGQGIRRLVWDGSASGSGLPEPTFTSTAMRSRSMAGAGAQQLSGVGKSRP